MVVFSKTKVCLSALAAALAVGVGCASIGYLLFRKLQKLRTFTAAEAFKLNINVVSEVEGCDALINELRRRSMCHNAIGFDCEWVTGKGGRQPVALMQLSTYDGFCVLFRLNCMADIPASLRHLLEDESIYKVGVAAVDDAGYLYNDHRITLNATLDIRHLAELCGYEYGGLASLSLAQLGVVLDKSLKVRCSNWDRENLKPEQEHYAASDAHAAIRIFVKLINDLNKKPLGKVWSSDGNDDIWEHLDDVCMDYVDVKFGRKNNQKTEGGSKSKSKNPEKEIVPKKWHNSVRTKPLYHNCYLQAPDGELLCTCDTKKALWYVDKGLADIVQEAPLTVRLRFEPAGRGVADVGKYYQIEKQNQCVVCGAKQSYLRKNVVPREYRKYFPEIMKDHSSHDILLLCSRCHQRSNLRDLALRRRLAVLCDAPLAQADRGRFSEDASFKRVRMAARALLQNGKKHLLPDAKKREMEAVVLNHYTEHSEITDGLLEEAAKCSNVIENTDFDDNCHGKIVVDHYLKDKRGLLRLEETWREHFLSTMKPQFMPELWSIKHNEDRLRVKWNEGRLSKEQLNSMGIEEW